MQFAAADSLTTLSLVLPSGTQRAYIAQWLKKRTAMTPYQYTVVEPQLITKDKCYYGSAYKCLEKSLVLHFIILAC